MAHICAFHSNTCLFYFHSLVSLLFSVLIVSCAERPSFTPPFVFPFFFIAPFSVPILSIFLAATATSITVPLITSVVLLPLPIQLVLFDSCYLWKKKVKNSKCHTEKMKHMKGNGKLNHYHMMGSGCKVGESFGALVKTRQREQLSSWSRF